MTVFNAKSRIVSGRNAAGQPVRIAETMDATEELYTVVGFATNATGDIDDGVIRRGFVDQEGQVGDVAGCYVGEGEATITGGRLSGSEEYLVHAIACRAWKSVDDSAGAAKIGTLMSSDELVAFMESVDVTLVAGHERIRLGKLSQMPDPRAYGGNTFSLSPRKFPNPIKLAAGTTCKLECKTVRPVAGLAASKIYHASFRLKATRTRITS